MTAGQRLIEQGRQQGIQQGIQQGRQQGIEQGCQQGIEQGRRLVRPVPRSSGDALEASDAR